MLYILGTQDWTFYSSLSITLTPLQEKNLSQKQKHQWFYNLLIQWQVLKQQRLKT